MIGTELLGTELVRVDWASLSLMGDSFSGESGAFRSGWLIIRGHLGVLNRRCRSNMSGWLRKRIISGSGG